MITDVKASEANPDVTVIVMGGALDGLTADADSAAIEEAAGKSTAGVLFDMTGVEFMGSAALHVFLRIHGAFADTEKQMAFAGLKPAIYKMFKIARLDSMFECFETQADAIKTFG
jgi:anti-anti-sigma factor